MNVSLDVINIISSYTVHNKYKLMDTIPIDDVRITPTWLRPTKGMLIFDTNFNWGNLPEKYNEIHLLDSDSIKTKWKWVSRDPDINFLFSNKNIEIYYKSYYNSLGSNSINPLEQYRNNINWDLFVYDPLIFDKDIIRTNKRIMNKAIILDRILN